MGEYLVKMKESRPILENFLFEFTKDISKSNVLFNKYDNSELQVKLVDVIEDAINGLGKSSHRYVIESNDLFGDYEWIVTCEKMSRGIFKDKDEVNFVISLESTLCSADGVESYSHTCRTFIHCIYI